MATNTSNGYWTEGKIVNGTNVGGGTFVPGTQPINTTLNGSALNNSSTINVPKPSAPIQSTITVAPPSGTTVDSSGNAIVTPPPQTTTQPASQKSTYQTILESIGIANKNVEKKGDVTSSLNTEQDISGKTQKATDSYNAYNKANIEYQTELQNRNFADQNTVGAVGGGFNAETERFKQLRTGQLANLAVQANMDSGNLKAAQEIVKNKIEAQFQPIQDNIDRLSKIAELTANDPEVKLQLAQKQVEMATTQKIATDLHQAVIDNGNPPGVLAALDKVSQDYASGKITASEAQSRYYTAAGKYGGDMLGQELKQAQINKARNEAAQALTTLPSAVQTRVQGVAGQFDNEQAVKNYQTVAQTIDAFRTLGTSPLDDQARIYAFAKTMDPNSVVREGEYKTAQAYAMATIESMGLKANRIFNNDGFLTEESRKFMSDTLDKSLASSKKAFDNIYSGYGKKIDKITGRADGTDYLVDYSAAFSSPSSSASSTPVTSGTLQSGITFKVIQ